MIGRDEALSLERSDLEALLARAAAVRDAGWGRTVTYARKVFIPLTRLCRNACGYCAFARPAAAVEAAYMSIEEAVAVAEAGRRAGCTEALLTLGERPEVRHPEAREALRRAGAASTAAYLRAACAAVLERTGLLPHANGGALSEAELRLLAPAVASMGAMLETCADRLAASGAPHAASPDKAPARRLETLAAAGRLGIPFTTGLLVGIGETWAERVDALRAIAEAHRRHGHVQEAIVQNFRAKPGTPMAGAPEPSLEEMLRTIAAARLLLPPEVSLVAPPNLADGPSAFARYLAAGANDWGGVSPVTADHINPERPWPAVAALAEACASVGMSMRERLTVYPRVLLAGRLPPDVRAAAAALAGADGFAREDRAA